MAPEAPLARGGGGPSVGVFGGTFDPPHVGHLIVAGDLVAALDLDRMLWIPAGQPPHKDESAVSPAEVRWQMVRAAVADDPRFEASDIELRRAGVSYTVDTLRGLKEAGEEACLYLVVGADQFASLGTWKQPQDLARLARIVVLDREGLDPASVDPGIDVEWELVPVTRVDISSTDVRRRVADGESVRHLVPDGVRRIIEDQGLYARGS